MEQITIRKRDGSEVLLQSKRTVTSIKSAKQNVNLQGQDVVNITVESPFVQSYDIGDKIIIFGHEYTLNRLPIAKKTGAHKFVYNLEFEGVQYDLLRATYDLTIETTNNQLQDFQANSLTGSLSIFASVWLANVNRLFPGKWALGPNIPQTDEDKTLTFADDANCLSAINELCEAFGTEYKIEQVGGINIMHFTKLGTTHAMTFEYGRGKGVYELVRENVLSSNLITRLKTFGSSKNITLKYRAHRLCLPNRTKGQSFIEQPSAVAQYGVFEATKHFDDVYPNRTGIVSQISGDILTFVDNDMFDLNEKEADGITTKYVLPEVSPKVHFNTGNLAGYEFDIESYDHTTKTFKIVKYTDERGHEFPSNESPAFQFAQGDKYKLLDVALPQLYVDEAEMELEDKGTEYYLQNSQPKVQYSLSVDPAVLERQVGEGTVANIFTAGDYIKVKDADIGVDKSIRITAFTRDILRPYEYVLAISDTVTQSLINRVISDSVEVDKILNINNLKDPARARRNWRSAQEVLNMTFDADGDYFSSKIKPESIETVALSVGAKSMQFGLTNTVFQPNYNGNKNLIKVDGGILSHYTINENEIRSWNLSSSETTFNDSNQAYYIYAKCERAGTAGSILFSTQQIKTESDANYFHFWIGVVNSVDTNARSISLSYGFTMVNGRFINTGRIQSMDGQTYFDLDNSEIGGRIVFSSNGGQKTLEELGQESLDSKNYIDNTLPGLLGDIQAQLDGKIEQFFEQYDPLLTNAPAVDWTTTELKEQHLGDLFYNTDNGKVFRWVKVGGAYSWDELESSEVAQALALANDALALAKNKNRVFTVTPFTPYDVGDLWTQGSGGGIMRCKTTRLTGAYSSSDWEVASKYTDDTGLTSFINDTYNDQVDYLIGQIDGKIESWFQTSNPASAWTTNEIRGKHVGDMWYNSTTKVLQRYSPAFTWVLIEDKKALDAYQIANDAKDTADGKRRVFVAQPYPPYDIGDLWVDGTVLRRCDKNKATGVYAANDWVLAVTYDNTKTVIDGGIVTSGTVQLAGSGGSILAGITGEGTTAESVRIWAGASKSNKETAPFRVLQDGSFIAKKATIEGEINAVTGSIGGFEIGSGRIGATASPGSTTGQGFSLYENFIKFSDQYRWAMIGTNVFPASTGVVGLARFTNTTPNPYGANYGMLLKVEGGNRNIALQTVGNMVTDGLQTSYNRQTTTPPLNTVYIPGYKSNNIIVRFTNDNSGVGFPSRYSVADELGINSSTPFTVKMTIICDRFSTKRGSIYGRNTTVSGMNNSAYPYRLNNDATIQQGQLNMEKGDIDEFVLDFDGSNYVAYWLNHRN